ncbi:Uncharacterized conserved protein YbbK, DUF523 family [Aliiroseovarius sediminilitoris]|uniref:Uncharacterized conserved protein YbbK, DUF523 family n=1 Tax=Aliiroseovarius sediminilitoris TaxID=1173584 RepID=A0A1I0QVF3_9RHOB|nr:DUF523 domain-containing protein [Aliiroseovarius sediminilitoris]SEW31647.1 Uncharacterized conserved protein YbbK, DUF523 family [Aliiroseovarius sediminilitoris]
MSRLLVSACLMGQKVRYDGQSKTFLHACLSRWKAEGRLVPFCPELAGGLAVPRLPAEIEPDYGGDDVLAGRARVLDNAGTNVTAAFVTGAKRAVEMARSQGCTYALLTEASPSCGSTLLYSGHHDGAQRIGFGVTTAALRAAGVAVYAPNQIDALTRDCAW